MATIARRSEDAAFSMKKVGHVPTFLCWRIRDKLLVWSGMVFK
jgi:hypothetical protein